MIVLYNSPVVDKLAFKLVSDLKQMGEQVWFSLHEVTHPDNLEIENEEALRNADTVLFIASRESVSSSELLDKLKYSMQQNKMVILLYAEACTFPFSVSKLEAIDLSEDYYNGFTILKNVLQFQDEDSN